MGHIVLNEKRPYGRKVIAALKRRGLVPVADEEWIVHGPHPPLLRFRVFIGWVQQPEGLPMREFWNNSVIMVAVYPHAVYLIEDDDDSRWAQVRPKDRILIPN